MQEGGVSVMAEFATKCGEALTAVLGFIDPVWNVIVDNPLMFMGVGVFVAGIGFKHLKKGKRAAK